MRDRLRETTISRDYVDSIFRGMNDAIIVTSRAGSIKRVNKATLHLLGYEESQLLGMSIDDGLIHFVIGRNGTSDLRVIAPVRRPVRRRLPGTD